MNQSCEQLIPQIHVHYKVLPSILCSTPKLLFKTSSTISKAPLTHSRKYSVTETPHEISPSSVLGSALGHTEVTIPTGCPLAVIYYLNG